MESHWPRYVFHLVRVGPALTVKLSGKVDKTNYTFEEERRWLFQQANPEWYVPALENGTSKIEVQLQTVSWF